MEMLKKYSALDAIKTAKQHVPNGVPIFVVGLKSDVYERQVSISQARYTKLLQHVYITRKEFGSMWVGEVSAKTGKYVNELILNIAAVIKRNADEQALKPQHMGSRSPTPGKTDHCVIG